MDWRTSFLLHMSPVSTTSWMLTQVMSKNNHWKSTDKSCLQSNIYYTLITRKGLVNKNNQIYMTILFFRI